MNSKNALLQQRFLVLFIFWVSIGLGNVLQEDRDSLNPETQRQLESQEDFFKDYRDSLSKGSFPDLVNLYDNENAVEFDSLTTSKYLEAYRSFFQNNIVNYQHSQKVFKWQLTSSKVIFITVIILVMSGIIFSGLQFKKGIDDSKTELEFSRDGVKVSSSILGVIILVISLVFFYLYLIHVYPIHEVF